MFGTWNIRMVQSFATTEEAIFSAPMPDFPNGKQLAGVNDIYVGEDGNLVLAGITGTDADQLQAVLYACQNVTRGQLGEMVLQINRGMPNKQLIWNGTPNYQLWQAVLINILQNVPGVTEVANIVLQKGFNTDSYNNTIDVLIYTVTVVTAFGTGVINGSL